MFQECAYLVTSALARASQKSAVSFVFVPLVTIPFPWGQAVSATVVSFLPAAGSPEEILNLQFFQQGRGKAIFRVHMAEDVMKKKL